MRAARSIGIASVVLALEATGCGSSGVLQLFPDYASVSIGDGSPEPNDATTRADRDETNDAGVPADSAADGLAASDGQPGGDAAARGEHDAGPICYPSWACGPCTTDLSCNSGPLPGHCDPTSKRCVECLSNSDCLDKVCVAGQLTCE